MPEKATQQRVEKDRREGKAPSTQAGEFVREEIEHVREGKHGARAVSSRRSRAALRALTREGRAAASRNALSRQGRTAAARRTKQSRSAAARRAAATRKRRR